MAGIWLSNSRPRRRRSLPPGGRLPAKHLLAGVGRGGLRLSSVGCERLLLRWSSSGALAHARPDLFEGAAMEGVLFAMTSTTTKTYVPNQRREELELLELDLRHCWGYGEKRARSVGAERQRIKGKGCWAPHATKTYIPNLSILQIPPCNSP